MLNPIVDPTMVNVGAILLAWAEKRFPNQPNRQIMFIGLVVGGVTFLSCLGVLGIVCLFGWLA